MEAIKSLLISRGCSVDPSVWVEIGETFIVKAKPDTVMEDINRDTDTKCQAYKWKGYDKIGLTKYKAPGGWINSTCGFITQCGNNPSCGEFCGSHKDQPLGVRGQFIPVTMDVKVGSKTVTRLIVNDPVAHRMRPDSEIPVGPHQGKGKQTPFDLEAIQKQAGEKAVADYLAKQAAKEQAANVESESDSGSEIDVESDVESGSEIDVESGSEVESEVESDVESETDLSETKKAAKAAKAAKANDDAERWACPTCKGRSLMASQKCFKCQAPKPSAMEAADKDN